MSWTTIRYHAYFFFFFKQKTAYEIGVRLVGSEMCIRDSPYHKDPDDSHLRIAPTYPSLDEVATASDLLCVCVRLAAVEKLLTEKD